MRACRFLCVVPTTLTVLLFTTIREGVGRALTKELTAVEANVDELVSDLQASTTEADTSC